MEFTVTLAAARNVAGYLYGCALRLDDGHMFAGYVLFNPMRDAEPAIGQRLQIREKSCEIKTLPEARYYVLA